MTHDQEEQQKSDQTAAELLSEIGEKIRENDIEGIVKLHPEKSGPLYYQFLEKTKTDPEYHIVQPVILENLLKRDYTVGVRATRWALEAFTENEKLTQQILKTWKESLCGSQYNRLGEKKYKPDQEQYDGAKAALHETYVSKLWRKAVLGVMLDTLENISMPPLNRMNEYRYMQLHVFDKNDSAYSHMGKAWKNAYKEAVTGATTSKGKKDARMQRMERARITVDSKAVTGSYKTDPSSIKSIALQGLMMDIQHILDKKNSTRFSEEERHQAIKHALFLADHPMLSSKKAEKLGNIMLDNLDLFEAPEERMDVIAAFSQRLPDGSTAQKLANVWEKNFQSYEKRNPKLAMDMAYESSSKAHMGTPLEQKAAHIYQRLVMQNAPLMDDPYITDPNVRRMRIFRRMANEQVDNNREGSALEKECVKGWRNLANALIHQTSIPNRERKDTVGNAAATVIQTDNKSRMLKKEAKIILEKFGIVPHEEGTKLSPKEFYKYFKLKITN